MDAAVIVQRTYPRWPLKYFTNGFSSSIEAVRTTSTWTECAHLAVAVSVPFLWKGGAA
jgi:hypothetical protein